MAYPGVDKMLTHAGSSGPQRRDAEGQFASAGKTGVMSNKERRAESLRREASALGATDAEDLSFRGRSPIRPRVKMGSRAY